MLSRRQFIKQALRRGVPILGGGAAYSLAEASWLKVYRVNAPLPGLPAPLEGFTICQMTDLHRGPLVTEAHIRRASGMAMSLNPDMIVLTGDFVQNSARFAGSCGEALSILRARHGVYGVFGNHDHWSGDIEGVAAGLRPSGMTLLVNQAVQIRVEDCEWWLCGLDDSWSGRPDLPKTLADVPEGAFKILLCHEPDFADTAAKYDIELQLSGHSHGGQVSLPLIGPVILPPHGRKYPVGLQRVGDTGSWVYTSRGIGVSFPPVRLNCRPEITLLTLSRA